MNKGMIIGLGHPRTGTTSLASLLDIQQWFTVTHEHQIRMPWENAETYLLMNFNNIYMYPSLVVGDVGFYYLNYVEKLLKMYPIIRFVCMKRPKDPTIKSLQKMMNMFHVNHLIDRTSKYWNDSWLTDTEEALMYRGCFPKYNVNPKDALSQYYDEYYKRVDALTKKINRNHFRVFDMDYAFNTGEGQEELLKDYLMLNNPLYNIGIQVFKTGEEEDEFIKK